jgi:hypothetical protein
LERGGQTHKGELQEQTTEDAIKKAFQDAGITPFKDGEWKKYVESSFLAQPAAWHILHKVHKLQQKNAISAYLFSLGLEDPSQNPEDWNFSDPREGEGGGEMPQGKDTADGFNFPSPVSLPSSPEELYNKLEMTLSVF